MLLNKLMGLTKSENYTRSQNELATLAKVLSSPARIAILEILISENACICRDLTQELGLSQPTVSKHLKELRDAGLIAGNIEGASRSYCINLESWKRAKAIFGKFLGSCC